MDVSSEDYADYLRYKNLANYGINTVTTGMIRAIQDMPRATVKIAGCPVDFLVDTGSPVNVIDEITFKSK